ncbi:MAG: acetyl-CoA decarbonylase/synthase complex subunit gamma [Candidatus Omnitrophota bacterium]
MALSGLDIYKLLPKTNCRDCGFVTCLAFAMQLAKKSVSINKCPYLKDDVKKALEASNQPPVKLVTLGEGDNKLELGNETVLFRHEEKFHHPCAIGFILGDGLKNDEIISKLDKINQLKFERVGQKLDVNLIAVKQSGAAARFVETVKLVASKTGLNLILMSSDVVGLKAAAEALKPKKPLIYAATSENFTEIAKVSVEYGLPVVASAKDLEALSKLTQDLSSKGVNDLVIDTGEKTVKEKIWDLTQIRRQALKKANRSLGYPILAIVQDSDPCSEAMKAATYISKYASIVLISGVEPEETLSLLTLRQNIYTDPQKPLQIESKIYAIGAVTDKSPLMVTTNFSLSYYTVLGEVEACKIPCYIMSVNTEGMSVLTAWAAEKFTPEKIAESLNKFEAANLVRHKKLIIPGYVAVMSGDLQDQSGWDIIVGPKEAAGLPSFLKNLS